MVTARRFLYGVWALHEVQSVMGSELLWGRSTMGLIHHRSAESVMRFTKNTMTVRRVKLIYEGFLHYEDKWRCCVWLWKDQKCPVCLKGEEV